MVKPILFARGDYLPQEQSNGWTLSSYYRFMLFQCTQPFCCHPNFLKQIHATVRKTTNTKTAHHGLSLGQQIIKDMSERLLLRWLMTTGNSVRILAP